MSDQLHPDLLEWVRKPGPARFLEDLHARLRNGGHVRGRMRFRHGPITEDQRRELVTLFGNNVVDLKSIHLGQAEASLAASRFPMSLEQLAAAAHGKVVTRSAAKQARDEWNTAQVMAARRELITEMLPVSELDAERALLSSLPPSTTFRVPPGTATKAGAWTSYDQAVRAAAKWWPRFRASRTGDHTYEKGLATMALGGAKRWTIAGKLAFQNLIGRPFDHAVMVAETSIRLRGPLVWRIHDVVVDCAEGHPWVSIPAGGRARPGELEAKADGILLVENQETFDQVCQLTSVHKNWLCVWNKGFASKGLIQFLRAFGDEVPIAAWCDMDPSGIDIIRHVAEQVGRDVHPVGMEPELWEIATKRHDTPDQLDKWRLMAARQACEGPERLRVLASRIARTGQRVEQENPAVVDEVIPTLGQRLQAVLDRRTP